MTNEYIMCSLRSSDLDEFLEYARESKFNIIGSTQSTLDGNTVGHVLVKLYL